MKTFSILPTIMTNICGKFYSNPFTKYRDIASHKLGLTNEQTDREPAGRTRTHNASQA